MFRKTTSRRTILSLIALALLLAGSAMAETMTYLTDTGEIELEPAADRVGVRLADGAGPETALAAAEAVGWEATGAVIGDRWRLLSRSGRDASRLNLESLAGIAAVSPVFVWEDGVELIPTKEIIVQFATGRSPDEMDEFLTRYGVTVAKTYRDPNRVLLTSTSPLGFGAELELAAAMYRDADTAWAQPNFIRLGMKMGRLTPNDFWYQDQWHLPQIAAPAGWDVQTGDPDVVIAVIDDGVDPMHEDLGSYLETGWDAVDWDYTPDPNCADGHGTACAGLAAAGTDNGFGVAGVGFDCRIMPVRIFDGEYVEDAWIIDALDMAEFMGADVFSCSWGGGPSSPGITAEIDQATQYGRDGKGCVVVFAAGNSGGAIQYPAHLPNVIAVGAVDRSDQRWYYSCTGSSLDVVAPSGDVGLTGDVVTTDVSWECGYEDGANPNYTFRFGGTSAACPQVAGLAGLVLSQDPQLTYQQAMSAIYDGCDDLGPDDWYGHGRINCGATLEALLPEPEVTVTYPNTAVTWTIGEQVTITWSSCGAGCGITGHAVELRRGAGAWQTLGTVGAAARSFDWTVTGPASSSCLVRVVANVAGGGSVSDQGDAAFTIQTEPPSIIDVTDQAFDVHPAYTSDASWGDFTRDGDLDLYVTHSGDDEGNRLYVNDGNGVFGTVVKPLVVGDGRYTGADWLDLDGDGDLDLHAVCVTGEDLLLEWDGLGFVPYVTGFAASTEVRGRSNWHDHDADGAPDLLAVYRDAPNVLYLHEDDGTFTSAASPVPELPGRELEAVWCDFDNDGDQDLHVFNYDSGNQFFVNQGDGEFVDLHDAYFGAVGNYRSVNWGDYDNDGYLDVATHAEGCLILLRNVQGQGFELIPLSTHGVCIGGFAADYQWLDFDNDGLLDIICAVHADGGSELFFGNGDGTFADGIPVEGHSHRQFHPADYDNDGDLDLYATYGSGHWLLENHLYASGNHWLQLELVDRHGRLAPLGARVVVHDAHGAQTRVVGVSDDAAADVVFFGLGDTVTISQVLVYWPDGTVQDATDDIAVDQRQTVTQPSHVVTAEILKDGQSYGIDEAVLFGCPAGDADELVLTIDFDDDEVSGTVAAADVSLLLDGAGFGICGAPYADEDGTVDNGYTVTIRRKHIFGCSGCEGDGCHDENIGTPAIRIGYDGEIVALVPGLSVRSDDFTGDGVVNLSDVQRLSMSLHKSLGDPGYDGCVDLSGDDVVNLVDVALFSGHNGHGCGNAKSASVERSVASPVEVESAGHGRRRLFLRTAADMELAVVELAAGGPEGVRSWNAVPGEGNVACVGSRRDGQEIVFIVVSDLAAVDTGRLALVDVVVAEGAEKNTDPALDAAVVSVMRADGTVVRYAGGEGLPTATANTSGVRRVYPNPFNPRVTIEYAVARTAHVQIRVYDLAGRLVRTLVDEERPAGQLHAVDWDGLDARGQRAASGVYVWRMKTQDHEESGRVMLVK